MDKSTLRLGTGHNSIGTAPTHAPVKEILVVDDLPEITMLFRDVCRGIRGFTTRVTTEVQAVRALDLVCTRPFDLVVSDFRMRGADGIDVLRSAYVMNPTGHRVLMTGYNEIPASIGRIRDAHVDAYIQKPLDHQGLLMMLTAFLTGQTREIDTYRAEARELEDVAILEENAMTSHEDAHGAALP